MSHSRLARFLVLACLTLLPLMALTPVAAGWWAQPIFVAPTSPMEVPWGG